MHVQFSLIICCSIFDLIFDISAARWAELPHLLPQRLIIRSAWPWRTTAGRGRQPVNFQTCGWRPPTRTPAHRASCPPRDVWSWVIRHLCSLLQAHPRHPGGREELSAYAVKASYLMVCAECAEGTQRLTGEVVQCRQSVFWLIRKSQRQWMMLCQWWSVKWGTNNKPKCRMKCAPHGREHSAG